MSIRKTSRIINTIAFFAIAVAVWALINLSQRVDELDEAATNRFYMFYLVNELRQNSAELTRQIRIYVTTSDPEAEAAFHRVIAIQEGEIPRPMDTFIAPGENRALLELMREYGLTDEEYALLELAVELSDALVVLETQAMYASRGIFMDAYGEFTIQGEPDRELALSLVLGAAYDAAIQEIMVPMDEFEDKLNARVNRVVDETRYHKAVARTIAFVAIGVILFIVVFYVLFINLIVVRPLRVITASLKTVFEDGKMHLGRRIHIKKRNEIGVMADFFNKAFENIASLVLVIKNKSEELTAVGDNLSNNMSNTEEAVHQITANVNNIKDRVATQTTSVAQTNSTMELLATNIKKLGAHVDDQSAHVSDVSSAIEEMVANIRSVTDTLVKNETNVRMLMESSDAGRSGLQDVVQDIQEIAKESEGLLEINAVVENIASQTNLLSMNAAIEAAHAGDAGKGFAVVADEIRKLAEGSAEQSKTIGTALKKMKDSVDKITRSTGNVLDRFEAIDVSVKTVTEQEDAIRNSMEEQRTGSKQVLDGISSVVGITHQVSIGSDEMLKSVSEVIQESKNLERTTQDINNMTYGTDEIDAAISTTNNISLANRENIAVLVKEISRFTVD